MSLKALTGSYGADALDETRGAASVAHPGDASRPESSLTVLLAEGDPAHAARLKKILGKLGYSVVQTAHDGQETCLLCQKLKPDLVLLNQTLPKMDGLQAAFVINRNQPLPIVLLVSQLNPNLAEEVVKAGVNACVFQPVEPGLLAQSLELGWQNFLRIRDMEKQVHDLRQEINTRKLMGRASGILMKRLNLNQEQAVQWLYDQAKTEGVAPAEAARAVIEEARSFL
jgi:AmiR/NasT family two-component response regulator